MRRNWIFGLLTILLCTFLILLITELAIRISGKAASWSEKNGKDMFHHMIKKILHGFTQDARFKS